MIYDRRYFDYTYDGKIVIKFDEYNDDTEGAAIALASACDDLWWFLDEDM